MHHFGHSWGSPRAKAKMWLRFLAIRIFGGTRLKTLRQLAKALFERGEQGSLLTIADAISRALGQLMLRARSLLSHGKLHFDVSVWVPLSCKIKVRERGLLQLGPHVTIGYQGRRRPRRQGCDDFRWRAVILGTALHAQRTAVD